MTFHEAEIKAEEGNFMTHRGFSSYESMHYFNGELYYEDGAVINHHLSWLFENIKDFGENWEIKYSADMVDKEKLAQLHNKAGSLMISHFGESYEDAIMKGEK